MTNRDRPELFIRVVLVFILALYVTISCTIYRWAHLNADKSNN